MWIAKRRWRRAPHLSLPRTGWELLKCLSRQYLRAEFEKAARLRMWLFVLQLAVALPGALAVVIPDQYGGALYWLVIAGFVLLVL